VASDVDGTLTRKDRQIDLEAIEALRACEAAGVPVVLATGNVLPIAYALSYFIGTSGPVVAENGGLILHAGKVARVTDPRPALAAHEAVARHTGAQRLFTDQWRVTEVAYPERSGTLARVRGAIRKEGLEGTVRIERTGFAVHLMDPRHSKFEGVRRALSLLGVEPSDALAVGDSDNDRSMLQGCRVGVALGDASPGLKRVADMVASAPGGAGIWQALERYGVARRGPSGAATGASGRPTRARRPPTARARRPRR
jgi:phosphoglycolate phosphatase (TIGR01487 family)